MSSDPNAEPHVFIDAHLKERSCYRFIRSHRFHQFLAFILVLLLSISLGFLLSESMAESDSERMAQPDSERMAQPDSERMAEPDIQINQSAQKREMEKLQYLELVHLASIRAILFVSNLYFYAKRNAGPLKNGVESVEGTVKTVIGPVYDRYHTVPFDLLKIADRKVGTSVQELERHVPEAVRSVVEEVRRTGVAETAAGLAKAACVRVEPAAERLAVSAWKSLNRLPVFSRVAQAAVPAAAVLSERYNRAVSCAAKKGYAFSAYLPLVPTERIASVFHAAASE